MKCTGESVRTVLSPFFPLSAFSWSSQPLLLGLHEWNGPLGQPREGDPKGNCSALCFVFVHCVACREAFPPVAGYHVHKILEP